MAKVLMYLTAACPFCQSADRLLQQKGVAVEKIRVDLEPARRAEMMQKSGRRTVPQIRINPNILGGIIVRVGDKVMDGSVRRRLGILRTRMMAKQGR